MKNFLMTICFVVLLLGLCGSAQADTLNVPGDYETIQAAIDDAVNGDEIEVGPGTYNEAINYLGKAVRLYSSGGPEFTTIDASGLDSSVVSCVSGEDENTILEGLPSRVEPVQKILSKEDSAAAECITKKAARQ